MFLSDNKKQACYTRQQCRSLELQDVHVVDAGATALRTAFSSMIREKTLYLQDDACSKRRDSFLYQGFGHYFITSELIAPFGTTFAQQL